MKKKYTRIIIVVILSLLCLILIKPLIPGYFTMIFLGKLLYVIGMYGFPIYIIIPIGFLSFLILMPRIRRNNYWGLFENVTRKIYFIFSIIILVINLLLVVSKFALKNDPFTLIPYSSITGTSQDLSDIREGEFYWEDHTIIRTEFLETVISNTKRDTIEFDLEWISNNEYELTAPDVIFWVKDNKTRVVITRNDPEYYECYTKYGNYAVHNRVLKK